jgi:ectoine hydroxylase-related dioxygenase (phytanoyl-CoA dioxygenase family)
MQAVDTFTQAYATDGYAAVPGFLPPAWLARLQRAVDAVAAVGRDFTADTSVKGAKYQIQTASGRPGDAAVAPGVFRKIMFAHKISRDLRAFRSDACWRAPLAALGVTAPRCVLDQINYKVAHVGTGFPWHQDAYFIPPLRQAAIANFGGANCVIALDPADAENGAFAVLPGTHTKGPVAFDYDIGAPDGAAFEAAGAVVLAMAPGDAVFFHPYLLHASARNRSPRARRILTYWFINEPHRQD